MKPIAQPGLLQSEDPFPIPGAVRRGLIDAALHDLVFPGPREAGGDGDRGTATDTDAAPDDSDLLLDWIAAQAPARCCGEDQVESHHLPPGNLVATGWFVLASSVPPGNAPADPIRSDQVEPPTSGPAPLQAGQSPVMTP